jgi:hypothetical protein
MGRLGSGAPQRMICAGAIFGCGRAESFSLGKPGRSKKVRKQRFGAGGGLRVRGLMGSQRVEPRGWGWNWAEEWYPVSLGESLVTKLMRLLVSHSFWVILWCFKSRLLPSAFRRKNLTVSSFGILMPAASAFSYQNMLSGTMQAHVMSPSGRGVLRLTIHS